MPESTFVIWRNRYEEGKCVILQPKGIDKQYQLSRGVSRLQGWPRAVVCAMNPEFPKDIELSDNLFGTTLIVISKRLRDSLMGQGVADVEFLPVQIVNHKKKVASTEFFILNPPSVVECIDLKASEVEWNRVNPEIISSCKQLVIKNNAVPDHVRVFRPKHLPTKILIRAALAKTLSGDGMSGLWFSDPAEFTG